MADFALWGEAISQAMGNKPLVFLNTYYENIGRQNIEAIEANPLGQAISKFCEQEGLENKAWEGSPGKLLEQLNKVAATNNIDTTQKMWPRATNSLTKRIKQIQSNLLEGLGIKITISRDNKKNTSTIRVEKEPPLPPEPPIDKNQAQKQVQNAGGTLAPGCSKPPVDEEPPTNNLENQAQKSGIGGTGGSGGILPTLIGGQQKKKANETENDSLPSSSSSVESNPIYRLGHSDTWACHNCKQKGDKWFMQKHMCRG
jgi:hypothetical protein